MWPWLLGDLYGSIIALQCLQRIPLQRRHWYLGMLQSTTTLCAMERNTTSTSVSFPDQIPIPFVPLSVLWTALKVKIINELYTNALKFTIYWVQLSLHATVMAISGWSTKWQITPLMAPSQLQEGLKCALTFHTSPCVISIGTQLMLRSFAKTI